ncbi:MAG: DNA-binding response regulator [Methylococcaceae bacterium TMED69]|nr:MAG: DNA-binding response regulator [Methylococcaceae bacterium TMED69]
MKILIVEDDSETLSFIKKGFEQDGNLVDAATNGEDGLLMATTSDYDVIILDRMLPRIDGLSVVRTLRANDNNTPILILSAMSEVDQRVEGLEAGCDDYLVKPFAYSELKARTIILSRRRDSRITSNEITVGKLKLDQRKRQVFLGGSEVILKPREFKLLEYLMLHSGQVVTRTMLLEHVWDYHFDPQTNIIDVHISRLRTKIDRSQSDSMIETVRGAGYRIVG